VDKRWFDWLDGLTMAFEHDSSGQWTTVLTVGVDQSALRGVLNRMWDLNLTLLSVRRRDPAKEQE
jgi:hypothetical protein